MSLSLVSALRARPDIVRWAGLLALLGGLALAEPARAAVPAQAGDLAFFTGKPLPVEALSWFAHPVLAPAAVSAEELALLRRAGSEPAAALDLAADGALSRAQVLLQAGWAGFCATGLDRVPADEALRRLQALHDLAPAASLFLRGRVDLVAKARAWLSGFVADGVLTRPPGAVWRRRPAAEAEAALAPLRVVRDRLGLPVTLVEHAPPGPKDEARRLAAEIMDLGFSPWVLDGSRPDALGLGRLEPIPRRVLVLIDGAEERYFPYVLAHRLLALPLEHLGYAIDYADVRAALPDGELGARYAGIVTWFTDDDLPAAARFQGWLATQIGRGVRVAILGRLGFNADRRFLARLGLEPQPGALVPPVAITARDAGLVGFEAPPRPLARDVRRWKLTNGTPHLQVADAAGHATTPILTAPWGGLALDPYLLEPGLGGRYRWILDPFSFLVRALDLPAIPAPDPTTDNGLRLLELHIDGDGFASKAEIPGHPFAGEVIRRQFLERYRLPHTVSVIEGEVGPDGLYKALAPALEPIARTIFALPHVEVASHSYSHPFDWLRAEGDMSAGEPDERDKGEPHLPIPGYQYAVEREVTGSVRYINERLAPPHKPTRVFLWSGTALPGEDALRLSDRLALLNMNGTNAEEPRDAPTLAQVPSWGRFVGPHLQAYAPAQNENVYTNLWHGPFYGFRDVIKGFEFTETPRRLKPISIYYHFYSGTKPAAIEALRQVYDWALAQETRPVYVSELVQRIDDFQRVTLARRWDGGFELRGLTRLRTVRLDRRLGWPDLDRAVDVVGVREVAQGRYVALSGADRVVLPLRAERPSGPRLESANGEVLLWRRTPEGVTFRVRGHVPAEVAVAGCARGGVVSGARISRRAGAVRLRFTGADTGEVTLACR